MGNLRSAERRLLVIQCIAELAQWIDIFLIFSVPSFVWQVSPKEIAIIAAVFGLPSLFLGPIFGAFLDRSDPQRLMLWGAAARTFLSAAIAAATGFEVFVVLVFAKGLANLLYWPSSSIVTNAVVAQDRRVPYFSSISAVSQVAKIGTPMLAGALSVLMPSQLVFVVSAFATAICFTLLVGLKVERSNNQERNVRNVAALLKSLAEGFSSIRALPAGLRITIVLAVSMSSALAIYDPHLARFLSASGFSPVVYSLVISSTGLGALAAATLVRLKLNQLSPQSLMALGIGTFCAAVAGTAFVVELLPEMLSRSGLAVLWFFNGFGYEAFVIGMSVTVQNLCPPEFLGRVTTSARSMQLTATVLGPSLGSFLIAQYGRGAPFVVSAVIAMSLTAGVIAWTRRIPSNLPAA